MRYILEKVDKLTLKGERSTIVVSYFLVRITHAHFHETSSFVSSGIKILPGEHWKSERRSKRDDFAERRTSLAGAVISLRKGPWPGKGRGMKEKQVRIE